MKINLTKKIKTEIEVSYLSINLRFLRKINGTTQAQCAKNFNVSRSMIGAYEEGRARPPYEVLIEMSNAYGVTIDDMLKKEITEVYPKEL